MEAIDIFGWVDGFGDGDFIGATRCRTLNEYSVDRIICVQVRNDLHQLVLADTAWQVDSRRANTDSLARAFFVSDIDMARRVFAGEHDSEVRLDPLGLQSRNSTDQFILDARS